MKRREFIGLVGGAAAWPLTASAQQAEGKLVTIGILAIEPWPSIDAFRHALDARWYIEGKNVRFVYRYAKGHNERLPELANPVGFRPRAETQLAATGPRVETVRRSWAIMTALG